MSRKRKVAIAAAIGVFVLLINSPPTYALKFPIAPNNANLCPSWQKINLAWATPNFRQDWDFLCLQDDSKWFIWHSRKLNDNWPDNQVLMLWGVENENGFNYLERFYEDVPPDYTGEILFVNEPDLCFYLAGTTDGWVKPPPDERTQACLTPTETVDLLLEVAAYCQGCRWVGPNISHVDAAFGAGWLDDFLTELNSRVGNLDLIYINAMHIYDYWPDLTAEAYLNNYWNGAIVPHGLDNRPVWVTEVGACNTPEQYDNMQGFLNFLEDDARVTEWFFFTNREINPLYGCNNGALSPDGEVWPVGRLLRTGDQAQ